MTNWTEKLFDTKKPVIAMLHLDPLPGDPRYHFGDSMDQVVAHALDDLRALQYGGVDGILISNEFSLPYERDMSFITPAAMARVIGEIKSEIIVPFGVDCISDGLATIELAAAVNADFVRGTFSGVYVGDGGFYNNNLSSLLRRKSALHLNNLRMLYFINPESDKNLDTRDLSEISKSTMFKAHPDGLCVSAKAAGKDVSNALIEKLKTDLPNSIIFCNTGCTLSTITDKLTLADGAVVGTYFKANGAFESQDFENIRVDRERVKQFMDVVKAFRE